MDSLHFLPSTETHPGCLNKQHSAGSSLKFQGLLQRPRPERPASSPHLPFRRLSKMPVNYLDPCAGMNIHSKEHLLAQDRSLLPHRSIRQRVSNSVPPRPSENSSVQL